jgi:hypothetical protein
VEQAVHGALYIPAMTFTSSTRGAVFYSTKWKGRNSSWYWTVELIAGFIGLETKRPFYHGDWRNEQFKKHTDVS